MHDAFNAYRGNGRALDGGKQHASQGVADCGPETTLKGLRGKLSVLVRQRIGVCYQALRFLESLPKHRFQTSLAAHLGGPPLVHSDPYYFEYSSTIICSR